MLVNVLEGSDACAPRPHVRLVDYARPLRNVYTIFLFRVMLFSLEEGLVQVTYMVWFSFNSVQWT